MNRCKNYCLVSVLVILLLLNHCQKTVYTYDDQSPQITSEPVVLETTDSTATIFWEMNEACHAQIKYGKTTKYDLVYTVTENRQIHTVTLTGLEPYTLYHFKVYNWDFAKNGPVKSDDLTLHTLHNEYSLLREGWRCYTAGQLDSARIFYTEALGRNALLPEIQAAFGWLDLCIGDIDSARKAFAQAYSLNPAEPVTLSGLATLAMIDNNPAQAINYLSQILTVSPTWQYAYYAPLNYKRLRLQLAEAYFQTAQYDKAQQQLDLVWPANGLNPNIPATWKVSGTTYPDYAAALFAAISYCTKNLAKRIG